MHRKGAKAFFLLNSTNRFKLFLKGNFFAIVINFATSAAGVVHTRRHRIVESFKISLMEHLKFFYLKRYKKSFPCHRLMQMDLLRNHNSLTRISLAPLFVSLFYSVAEHRSLIYMSPHYNDDGSHKVWLKIRKVDHFFSGLWLFFSPDLISNKITQFEPVIFTSLPLKKRKGKDSKEYVTTATHVGDEI
jgi:hypothetical protein